MAVILNATMSWVVFNDELMSSRNESSNQITLTLYQRDKPSHACSGKTETVVKTMG